MVPVQENPSGTTVTVCIRPPNSRASRVPSFSWRLTATGGTGGGAFGRPPLAGPAPARLLVGDAIEVTGRLAIEFAENSGLDLVGEDPHEQAAGQMVGSSPAHQLAPADPKLMQVQSRPGLRSLRRGRHQLSPVCDGISVEVSAIAQASLPRSAGAPAASMR